MSRIYSVTNHWIRITSKIFRKAHWTRKGNNSFRMWPEHIKNACICRDSKAASKQASGMSGMHDTSLFSFISPVLNFAIFPKSRKSLNLMIAKLSGDEVLVEFFLAFRGIEVLIEVSTASWRTRPYFRGIMWLIRRLWLSKSLYGDL